MFKNKKNGFFLSETIVIIAIVSLVLLGTFKLFSSVYSKYKEGENYNKISAINAVSSLKQYYSNKGFNYSTLLNGGYYLELTNLADYESSYYDKLKEQLYVNKVYLIDLTKVYDGTNINVFDVSLRKYLNTLKNSGDTAVILAVINGSEYASAPAVSKRPILIGDEYNEYVVLVPVNGTFIDPGYTNWDGATPTTSWEPNLDVTKAGTYYLTYNFEGFFLKRKVVVGGNTYDFSYTGAEQTFTAPKAGYYLLETWGAQGGGANSIYIGGYGGYSRGVVSLTKNQLLYIYVGGQGGTCVLNTDFIGGYNGGGGCGYYASGTSSNGAGGGATHIATTTGLLSTLSSDPSSLLIVAGGGGGGSYNSTTANYRGTGGRAGGYVGMASINCGSTSYCPTGGTQIGGGIGDSSTYKMNGVFGAAGRTTGTTTNNTSGAGGGYYGGGEGAGPGAGGSGYIANSVLLSRNGITKSMYCYNCTISAADSTLTYSTTNISNAPNSLFAKIGAGHARISYLGE